MICFFGLTLTMGLGEHMLITNEYNNLYSSCQIDDLFQLFLTPRILPGWTRIILPDLPGIVKLRNMVIEVLLWRLKAEGRGAP